MPNPSKLDQLTMTRNCSLNFDSLSKPSAEFCPSTWEFKVNICLKITTVLCDEEITRRREKRAAEKQRRLAKLVALKAKSLQRKASKSRLSSKLSVEASESSKTKQRINDLENFYNEVIDNQISQTEDINVEDVHDKNLTSEPTTFKLVNSQTMRKLVRSTPLADGEMKAETSVGVEREGDEDDAGVGEDEMDGTDPADINLEDLESLPPSPRPADAYYIYNIPVSIPLSRGTDEVGNINMSRFIEVFGVSTMKIYNAILFKKRVLFVGYNHAAADIAQMVLTASALVAPYVDGIITRVYPYATLTDLSFLQV
jgi:hypothetical protein